MPISEVNIEEHPYRGMQTFTELHKNVFFGRAKPVDEIFSLMKNNMLTVVFGKSGIGKSSLINAGLVPKLRENFYLPVLIRIHFSDATIDPLVFTQNCIEAEVRRYIYKDFVYPENTTLWQFFREANFTGGAVIPVLIFDQFEEYFSFGKQHTQRLEKFIKELSDLIENRMPAQLADADTYKILSTTDTQNICRIIISLREDFLAPLEDLSRMIPSLNKVRYRIVQLHGEEAFDAVYLPAKKIINKTTAIHLLKKMIPKKINAATNNNDAHSGEDSWKDKDFEPYILSLFCYQVNEKRIAERQDKISEALINQTKVETILSDYYTSSLKKYWRRYRTKFGHILERSLISDEGYRLLKPVNAKELKSIPPKAMDDMINDRIIQKETRSEISYIEITHDLLAKVIYERKLARKKSRTSVIIAGSFIVLLIILFSLGLFKQNQFFNYKLQANKDTIDLLKAQDSIAAKDSVKNSLLHDQIVNLLTVSDTSNEKNTAIVYLQTNWNISQPQILSCIQVLKKLNFTVPGVEQKQTKPAINLIRYYYAKDEINADLIKSVCDRVYAQPFTIQYIKTYGNRVKPGTIEVWTIYEHHYQQLFSDTKDISENAVNYLTQTYKTDVTKQWPKKMVAAARANASDENGIYNMLLVFSKMDEDYLSDDKALILAWLKEVQQMNNKKFTPLVTAINDKLSN